VLGIDKLTSVKEIRRTSRRRDPSEAPLRGILIEELLPDELSKEEKEANSLPTAVGILLLAMQWGDQGENDDSITPSFSSLQRPWVTPATRNTSHNLLSALITKVPLISLLPCMMDALRPTITAAAVHAATETSRLEPYIGPDSWERSLAMGQLAAAVQWLSRDELWHEEKESGDVLWQLHLFPVLTAAVQDPSPSVQNYALWTLHHIFTISNAKELAPWAVKLVEMNRRAIIGCDEIVWPAAAAASTLLARKLDAGGGAASVMFSTTPAYNPHFITLFEALLDEAERHAHSPARSVIWLKTVPLTVFPLLGIHLTRYFRRLMPLLLEWCVSIQKKVRLSALRAVHAVVRATWPRMPAHAEVIWTVLESVYIDETVLSAHPSDEIVEFVVDVACLLWKCGGETFQQQKLSAGGGKAHNSGGGAVAEDEKVASLLDRVFSAVEVLEKEEKDVNAGLGAVKIEEL
jgi:hypothetical protein